jgi:hypothetical protein
MRVLAMVVAADVYGGRAIDRRGLGLQAPFVEVNMDIVGKTGRHIIIIVAAGGQAACQGREREQDKSSSDKHGDSSPSAAQIVGGNVSISRQARPVNGPSSIDALRCRQHNRQHLLGRLPA